MKAISKILISLICCGSHAAFGQGACTVLLSQVHFPISQSTNAIESLLVLKDMSNNIVELSGLPTQIVSRLAIACESRVPAISIDDAPMSSVIGYFIDSPFLDVEGSIGLGTLAPVYVGDPSALPWVHSLPTTNCILRVTGVTNVFFVEFIDRLAQFMNLETGILPSGSLIYGYNNNWLTNYLPVYKMELSIRYEE